ncbi:hypothetical protein [Paenibacillus sp. L3-i20]|uniref:hypothetical protein n=1 Tax=Paenibacillus sp. L3-i20 TaxID=2905833 RepID=UPI001EDF6337|nr:hypothetical protein [Paenibacillus sp. L3-i20]GKU77171.1 hypothetical protein L3i20_v215680 [Paenibacillus sp. L3-i20]
MLRKKIAVCTFVFLIIMSSAFLLHNEVKQDRLYYFMRPPANNDTFRIYNDNLNDHFDGTNKFNSRYTPYLPREYVKIIYKTAEQKQDSFDK